jgi:hypothetical protein
MCKNKIEECDPTGKQFELALASLDHLRKVYQEQEDKEIL